MNLLDKPSTSETLHPLDIARKAKELLAKRENTEITKLVTNICIGKQTEDDESPNRLYESFKTHFPNLLIVKLLQVYRSKTISCVRSHTLTLLDSILEDLEFSGKELKTEALLDIKEQLNACLLLHQETDFKLLSRIVSRVSVDLFINNISWDELCDFIIDEDDERELVMFSELPSLLDEAFLDRLLEDGLQGKIVNRLRNPGSDGDWCLGLESGFGLVLQASNLKRRDVIGDMVYEIVKSVKEREKETLVRKGLWLLVKKVSREAIRFREADYENVSRLATMLKNGQVSDETKMVVKKIQQVLDEKYMGGKELDLGFVESFTQQICLGN
ncbi:unnamed protein product [Microthlaspi erraticum]|uniref:DUF577 domain-containing protein n=1 Tax=Microthlaspi erraticum TaxID=1685480 RepID=A0A6D2JRX1_9BRAS|nr:unnamed protein product [Microthlaspi erraticum]